MEHNLGGPGMLPEWHSIQNEIKKSKELLNIFTYPLQHWIVQTSHQKNHTKVLCRNVRMFQVAYNHHVTKIASFGIHNLTLAVMKKEMYIRDKPRSKLQDYDFMTHGKLGVTYCLLAVKCQAGSMNHWKVIMIFEGNPASSHILDLGRSTDPPKSFLLEGRTLASMF